MNNQSNDPNRGMRPNMNPGQNLQQQQLLMMEQILNSGNPGSTMMNMFQNNLQSMNQQQRVLFLENFQRNLMMMQQHANFQSQGMMGNGNPGMQSIMGLQQGMMGNGNLQGQNMQSSLQQVQMQMSQGGNQNPMMSEGFVPPEGNSSAQTPRNPPVSTTNIKHQPSDVSGENVQSGKPILRGILKNSQSRSSDLTDVNSYNQMQLKCSQSSVSSTSSSRTQTFQSTQGISSTLKTSPVQTTTVLTSAKQNTDVLKSTASQQVPKVVTSRESSVSASQSKMSSASRNPVGWVQVEGKSIPTLVSSLRKHRESLGKRKAGVDIGSEVKKAKVTSQKAIPAVAQPDLEEEDPEYVQAQVFISNIPVDTTKEMILEILLHYKFSAPQVWVGKHNSVKNKICAFVKLPSLKDSKRVITEMNGFPYKGLKMEIRFSAAADFIDYTVPNSGSLLPQISQQPSAAAPPPVPSTSFPSALAPVPVSNTGFSAAPPVVHQSPVELGLIDPIAYVPVPVPVYAGVPSMYPQHIGYEPTPTDRPFLEQDRTFIDSEGPFPKDYRQSVSPRDRRDLSPEYSPHRDRYHSPYESRQRHSSRGYSRSSERSSQRRYSKSPENSSLRRYSRSPENSSYRRYSRSPEHSSQRRYSRSPENSSYRRYSRSPKHSSQRRFSRSPERSSYRRYSRSPEHSSQRRYSRSPESSSHRRYSRSPSFISRNPDHWSQRGDSLYGKERLPDPRDSDTISKHTNFSPNSSVKEKLGYGYETSPVSDLRRDRGDRSSLSPDRSYRESPYRRKPPDDFSIAHPDDSRGIMESYCAHIENLPPDITNPELESLIGKYVYDSVRLKVRDGRAMADVYTSSSTEAKMIMQNLDGKRFLGSELRAEWHRQTLATDIEMRDQPTRMLEQRDRAVQSSDREKARVTSNRDRSPRSLDTRKRERSSDRERSREGERPFTQSKEKTLFQSFIDASYPNAPVLGRKYIKEFSCKGDTKGFYLCILCEVTLTWNNISDHVMGYKHRLKCIKRSHPKIYDEICRVRNKVDMLGQCAKYAWQLENKRERIVHVDTTTPEATASQHLKKIKADRAREETKKEEKKMRDKTMKGENKRDEAVDTTSDIFKKIEAYKKKFEASKEQSEESGETPAKKPRKEESKKSSISFEDLAKKNKTLADSIQKQISSARKVTESSQERDAKKKVETDKKNNSGEKISKKAEENTSLRKSQIGANKKAESERKTSPKKLQSEENKKKTVIKESEVKNTAMVREQAKEVQKLSPKATEDKGKQPAKPKSVVESPNEIKGSLKEHKISESDVKKCEKNNVHKDEVEVIVLDSENEDFEENKNTEKEKSTIKESEKNELKETESEKDKGKNREEIHEKGKGIEKDLTEDLTNDPEDIQELGISIAAELFSEELADMEDEVNTEENVASEAEKISNHPYSVLKKYLDVQLLKDPENSGIIGLQYITEVLPAKGSKSHVFTCSLCDVKCAKSTIVSHIIGYKHRMKYFEVHHFDIYSNIMKMDQSRKFLNAECTRCAKEVQKKEGLKSIMTVTEKKTEGKDDSKSEKKEMPEEEVTEEKTELISEIKVNSKTASSLPPDKKSSETLEVIDLEEEETLVKVKDTVEETDNVNKSVKKSGGKQTLGLKLREAKAAAKLVSFIDGRENVELYKYIQQKPGVPLLGLNYVTEIQGLYGPKCKNATYCCQLCLPYTKIDGTASIYEHLIGIRHMENYLKKHFPHKMIHLKLLTQHHAKVTYLNNQAKLLCQAQLKVPESIYMVNISQMEEEKKARELAQAASKAVEEAAKAEAEALAAGKQGTMATKENVVRPKDSSSTEVIDLTAEEVKCELVVAHLYTMIAGLHNIPLVGLSYITEIQGISADNVPPRYECRLCDSELITSNFINAHITSLYHRLRFLKANYPVFYSKAEFDRDLAVKFCREIEEQFGRESISVKKRIAVRPDGSVLYSDPTVVKAPVENKEAERVTEQDVLETIEIMDGAQRAEMEEGKKSEEIFFYKIIEGLDCTPMLGLQYIKEIQHPSVEVPPVYECDVCNIKNGPYLNTKNILKHICSKEHRLKFMKENHFHLYQEIMSIQNEVQRKIAIDKQTKDIESKVGRGTIMKVISDKPTFWCKSNLEAKMQEDTVGEATVRENKVKDTGVEEAVVSVEETIEDEAKVVADEDQPQYKCKKCFSVVVRDRRNDHIISKHICTFKCKQCKLSFPNHFYLQKHVNTHHDRGCVLPQKKLDENFNMKKWFKWVSMKGRLPADQTGKVRFVCKQCHMVLKPADAKEHYICFHIKGYKCDVCEAPHGNNTALEKHLKLVHNITQVVPEKKYTEGIKLSKKYIHVHSFIPLESEEEGKAGSKGSSHEVQTDNPIGIQKYFCMRCSSLFKSLRFAEKHYKMTHFFQYPCTTCKMFYRNAAQLELHYRNYHGVYRSVKTPVYPFEKCFDVLRNDGKRMGLDEHMEQYSQMNKDTSGACTPAVAMDKDAVTKDTIAVAMETTAATDAEKTVGKDIAGDSRASDSSIHVTGSDSASDSTSSTTASAVAKTSGPVDLNALLSAREDELFDWDRDYTKIKERMKNGEITTTARKCKFMTNYTSTFSNYPLIGLEMVTEFQQRDIKALPWYICELCKDRIQWNGITAHMASVKHRIKYLEKNHTELKSIVQGRDFSSLTARVESLALGVVKKEGRKFCMKVMLELPPTEDELKTLSAKTTTGQGQASHAEKGAQSLPAKDKEERCSSNKQQQTSTVAENTPEGLRKKLPTWRKIPRVSAKTNQPQSASVVSIAETKGSSDEKQVKQTDKGTGSKVRKSSSDANSSKQHRDKVSKTREKSNSTRSSSGKEEHSKERSSRSDRNTRRHDREESSHRRKRSRSKDTDRRDTKLSRSGHDRLDRTYTKSSRSGHDRPSIRSRKNEDRKSPRESSRTKYSKPDSNIKSMNETSPKDSPSVSVVESESKETISCSQKLSEKASENDLNETEPIINDDDFSLEELELIGKCIEEQMTEEDELMAEDDDTVEVKIETNVSQEKSLTRETDERQQSTNDSAFELSDDQKLMNEFDRKNEMAITGKTEDSESVCQEQNVTTSKTCEVEISIGGSSPEKLKESERKDHETVESSDIEIDMNIQKRDLNVMEFSRMKGEKIKSIKNEEPPKNEEEKSEPNIDIKSTDNIVTPSTCTIAMDTFSQETSQSEPEQKELRTEREESKIGTDISKINTSTTVENKRTDIHVEEKKIFVTEEQSQSQVSTDDVLKVEIKPKSKNKIITGASTTEDSTVPKMTDILENDTVADFENFIASELGEDFVTVDDYLDSSPDMETELDMKFIPDKKMCVNEQESLSRSVEIKTKSRVVDTNKPNSEYENKKQFSESDISGIEEQNCKFVDTNKPNNEPEKTDNSENKKQFSESNISSIEEENNKLLAMVFEKESEFYIKGESSFSKSNERHDSNKQVENTNDTEEIPNVCVDKVNLKTIDEPSISECAEVDATMESCDDSGDIEFILTDEFLTVDEHIENDAEMEGSEAVITCENTRAETTSESSIPSKEKEDIKTVSVSFHNQMDKYEEIKLKLEDDQPVIEPFKNVGIPVTSKDENVDIPITRKDKNIDSPVNSKDESVDIPVTSKDENVDILITSKYENGDNPITSNDESVEKICSEVISSLPVDNDDDDDDDDIEEIFLGRDFVTVDTVDESKNKTPTPVEDTVGEELNEEDFFSEDFVTVDEVDADVDAETIKQTDQKDKSIIQSTGHDNNEIFQKHSSRSENKISSTRSRSKGSRSKERSVSRESGRSSKDRSELKKSKHGSESRLSDAEKNASSKKGDGSSTARHGSPEKSTTPSRKHPITSLSWKSPVTSSNRKSPLHKSPGTSSSQKSTTKSSIRETPVTSSSRKSPVIFSSRKSPVTFSSHQTPVTLSSSQKSAASSSSGGRSSTNTEAHTSSVEIGKTSSTKKPQSSRPSGVEVNVQVLSKQSLKDAIAGSRSLMMSYDLKSYSPRHSGKPRNIDTCSFLGISVRPASDATTLKESNKVEKGKTSEAGAGINVKFDGNKKSNDTGKGSSDVKTEKHSAEKKTKESSTSAKNVKDNKHSDSRSSKEKDRQKERVDTGSSKSEQSSGSRDKNDDKRHCKERSERKGKQAEECEISIDIG